MAVRISHGREAGSRPEEKRMSEMAAFTFGGGVIALMGTGTAVFKVSRYPFKAQMSCRPDEVLSDGGHRLPPPDPRREYEGECASQVRSPVKQTNNSRGLLQWLNLCDIVSLKTGKIRTTSHRGHAPRTRTRDDFRDI